MNYKNLILTALIGVTSPVFGAGSFKEQNEIRGGYKVVDGEIRSVDFVATLPVEEHYNKACEAFNAGNWPESAKHFFIVTSNYPGTTYAHDALFYQGVTCFHLQEFDIANKNFGYYLHCENNPKYFLEAMEYKLAVADHFRSGAKKHLFGKNYMPKWVTGRTLALEIYDEVIAAMPNHEFAARGLFAKGCLLWDLQEYTESIDAFQTMIRRFPKHEYTPEAYLFINKIYYTLAQREFQNSDYLALATINLRRFKQDFPQEERLNEAEEDVLSIKEVYARGLYDTGAFYEKIGQRHAASIYYKKALNDFPDTQVAQFCQGRLKSMTSSS